MDVFERRAIIEERVTDHGEVQFADLAREFGVSEMTIRRDIEVLQSAPTRETTAAEAQEVLTGPAPNSAPSVTLSSVPDSRSTTSALPRSKREVGPG